MSSSTGPTEFKAWSLYLHEGIANQIELDAMRELTQALETIMVRLYKLESRIARLEEPRKIR